MIKEFLTIRGEIDLNYIDLHPSNIETFGWKIDQPLIIVLEIDEVRLINSMDKAELPSMGFQQMQFKSAIKFSSVNNSSPKSFGC